MSSQAPEPPRTRSRLPFEPKPFGNAARRGAVLLYGALTAGLIGLALYMGVAVGHPPTSGYVAAPAVGAAWFGLRLFMALGSKG